MIKNFQIGFSLLHIHVQWIAANAFKLLWNTKLSHRKFERTLINKYCARLHEQMFNRKLYFNIGNVYQIPEQLFHPFDKIEI